VDSVFYPQIAIDIQPVVKVSRYSFWTPFLFAIIPYNYGF